MKLAHIVAILVLSVLAPPPVFAEGVGAKNLIENPTFAEGLVTSPDVPIGWEVGYWGDVPQPSFTYPVKGSDDNFAVQVSLPDFTPSGNGAAEWSFNPVSVSAGNIYRFSNAYRSDSVAYLEAQWTDAAHNQTYNAVATLLPTGGAWKNFSVYLSVPATAVQLAMFGKLKTPGTLSLDNFSLSVSAPAASEKFKSGMVTLAFDDGWASQYAAALPLLQASHIPASFYIVSSTIGSTASAYDLFADPSEKIAVNTSPHGVVWSPIYTDPTAARYRFSDTYTSDKENSIELIYTLDNIQQTKDLADLPAGKSAKSSVDFAVPVTADGKPVTPIIIAHVSAGGTLSAESPSLRELSGPESQYMDVSQVVELQTVGEEVGAHTRTHPDLTTLPPDKLKDEVKGSRSDILAAGIGQVTTFAYPYGTYNGEVESATSSAGFAAARSVDIGYNTKLSNPWALRTESVNIETGFDTVKSWIDVAAANKLWLVLTFHQIEPQDTLDKDGATDGTTPEVLSQIVEYLTSQQAAGKLKVETLSDAAQLLK